MAARPGARKWLVIAPLAVLGVIVIGALALAIPALAKKARSLQRLSLAMDCGEGNQEACNEANAIDASRCSEGDGHSCVLLGIAHDVGKRMPKDDVAALRYFEKGCELGNGSGCWYAGNRYLDGRGTARNPARAIELLRKACDAEDKNGCLDLGNAYEKVIPPQQEKALQAYDRGCKLGYDWACERGKKLRETSK